MLHTRRDSAVSKYCSSSGFNSSSTSRSDDTVKKYNATSEDILDFKDGFLNMVLTFFQATGRQGRQLFHEKCCRMTSKPAGTIPNTLG